MCHDLHAVANFYPPFQRAFMMDYYSVSERYLGANQHLMATRKAVAYGSIGVNDCAGADNRIIADPCGA
jgi:hypothetical protein